MKNAGKNFTINNLRSGLIIIAFSALFFIKPAFSFSGTMVTEPDSTLRKSAPLQMEKPDQPYVHVSRADQQKSPAYRYSTKGFFTYQVNVDENGDNIVGDAANEPSIAVDPTNPDIMVIGWRQFNTVNNNFRQAGYAYTIDGGVNWTFPGVIEPGIFRSDPVLDWDKEGNIYYNSLTVNGNNYTCDVYKSINGGTDWDGGTFAHGGDKQWMAIDKTTGIGAGNIYEYWSIAATSCYPYYFTRSIDENQSYENCSDSPFKYWGIMEVNSQGDLYMCGTNGYDFAVCKSSNAQDPSSEVSWDYDVTVDLGGSIVSGDGSFTVPNPDGILGQTSMAVDTSGRSTDGNLYLLCSVDPPGNDPLDVMFSRSTDDGQTWSSPVRINDDPGIDAWQWFGTMSVSNDGRIDVIWLDTRNYPGLFISELYYAYSLDGGFSWSDNIKLSEPFDPYAGFPQQNKMGDYFDMFSDEYGAHFAWANTLNGEEDVYYGFIESPTTGIAEQNDLSPNSSGLSYNFPNPFKNLTTINYKVPQLANVSLNVYNASGKQISSLYSGLQSEGNYNLKFDASGLPDGVYYYRLKVGSQSETKRLVVLR